MVNTIRNGISPKAFFMASMLALPALLFQKSALTAAVTVLIFGLLNLAKNGKVKLLPSFIVILFVTLFSLLNPVGLVLFRIGDFPVTQTALLIGLRKGLILTGMVMISKTAVSRGLSVPGALGETVGEMFGFFDRITAEKVKLVPGKIIEAIDSRFLEIYDSEEKDMKTGKKTTTLPGFVFLGLLLVSCWGLFLLSCF